MLFVRFGEPGTSACLSRLKTNKILPTVQNTITIQVILVVISTSQNFVVPLHQAKPKIMDSQAKVG